MANLTVERNTQARASKINQTQNVLNMPAATVAYFGLMKAADANQRAIDPVVGAARLFIAGVVKKTVDNSLGLADAKKVELETGEFRFDKDGTITTATPIGTSVYAVDNHTVATTASTGAGANWPLAGKLLEVHADGTVDVGIGPQYQSDPAAVA